MSQVLGRLVPVPVEQQPGPEARCGAACGYGPGYIRLYLPPSVPMVCTVQYSTVHGLCSLHSYSVWPGYGGGRGACDS